MSGWEIAFGWINVVLTLGGLVLLAWGALKSVKTAEDIYKKQKSINRDIEKEEQVIKETQSLMNAIREFRLAIMANEPVTQEASHGQYNIDNVKNSIKDNMNAIVDVFKIYNTAVFLPPRIEEVKNYLQDVYQITFLAEYMLDHNSSLNVKIIERYKTRVQKMIHEYDSKIWKPLNKVIKTAHENIDNLLAPQNG